MMVAREIYGKLEMGALSITDGWEGIKSGLMRAQSISLADYPLDDAERSTCAC